MRLHVFNPEHDIALAHNDPYFTAPRAGRVLREDLGSLPKLWAEADDVVLDKRKDLSRLPITEVLPWGWDTAIVHQLTRAGVKREVMPSDETLQAIRRLSSREFAAGILSSLVASNSLYVGEAHAIRSVDELNVMPCVLKEPWSSSGRGVRYVESLTDALGNWARNVIQRQSCLMVEPHYDKLLDFGMEFTVDAQGVSYRGLSVFSTINGFYTGNVVASEGEKMEHIVAACQTWDASLTKAFLASSASAICQLLAPHLTGIYNGPFGVDMMIVRTADGLRLHPMVEINLRRTMGHVAIDLYERGHRGRMAIDCQNGHYTFRMEDR